MTPTQTLRKLAAVRRMMVLEQFEAMTEARAQGRSWAQIGRAMGMTRQAARRWYVRRINPDPPRARRRSALGDRLAELGYDVGPK